MPTVTIHGIPSSYTGEHHSSRTPAKIAEAIREEFIGTVPPQDTNVSILLDHANQGEPIRQITIFINLLPGDEVYPVEFRNDISSRCSAVIRGFFKLTPIQCIIGVTTNTVMHQDTPSIEPYKGAGPCHQCGVQLKKNRGDWDCPNCSYIFQGPL